MGDRMDEPPASLCNAPDGSRVHCRWADAAEAEQVAALVHRLLSEISDRAAVPAFDRTLLFYAAHGFNPTGGRKMRWSRP